MKHDFWDYLQQLTDTNQIVIDRPKGSTHHRYPRNTYPVDYGFLEGTTSIDSGGVDIWVGSLGEKKVVGALCSVDLLKKDTELKILYDCSEDEIHAIIEFINTGQMRAIFVKKNE
jgi:inorganic pyrophosphatase